MHRLVSQVAQQEQPPPQEQQQPSQPHTLPHLGQIVAHSRGVDEIQRRLLTTGPVVSAQPAVEMVEAVTFEAVKVGPSSIEGAGSGLITVRDVNKKEHALIGYTGVNITRQQADLLEAAGLGTHIKSHRDTGILKDGHPGTGFY
eukprot:COSAG01_NODE_5254_length_4380_cov_3.719823_3_plen_144_part_00